MEGGLVVFHPVVCMIGVSGVPVEFEFLLAFAVLEPVKMHVHGFGAFWLNFCINYTLCHDIVGLYGSWWLFVAHFIKNYVDVYRFTCHDE